MSIKKGNKRTKELLRKVSVNTINGSGVSRRRFMKTGLTVAAALSLSGIAYRANALTGNTVAILGGGVAGLTAAHELIERGYTVTVYERRALGGKARSIPVPHTGTSGRLDLPGEHGFRFYPNFYHNLPDTLRRIPYSGNPHGAWSNLAALQNFLIALTGRPDFYVDTTTILVFPGTPAGIPQALTSLVNLLSAGLQIPPHELAFFVQKLHVFFTSGDLRRLGQWEKMSWWDYTQAANMSAAYQQLLGRIIIGFVAARPEIASARTIGQAVEGFFYSYAKRDVDNPFAGILRLMNHPTNEAWIDPWVHYLSQSGVTFSVGTQVTGFTFSNGHISSAQATDVNHAGINISADYFVLAVPAEQVVPLMSPAMVAADAQLGRIANLQIRWMNGIQFFLTAATAVPLMECIDSPWAIGGGTQAQFWPVGFSTTYGDGSVKDVLSIIIAEWTQPGIVYKKPANQCTPQEIANEVLAQIRAGLDNGASVLPDSLIHSWFLDPGLSNVGTSTIRNDDPLLVNTPNSWINRPDTSSQIDNLFLAGDYVRAKGFDLACMETANESGRRAANAILVASNSTASPAPIVSRYKEPLLALDQTLDDTLYRLGLPNQYDLISPYRPS
ncbi:NAD-binding domain and a Fe-S cluster-containing protein [Pseudomonas asplenii]|uniref:NAD-binding domain and a Fe-S cluster-containing protein n=1 Tax=Pseudomonas asplenii TaxID=53407 RepID=A0A1H1NW41_9PSED|nr:FAD-dependent oxidoreductase [Pseudomonas asplenii]SDS03167.1 NAD-binding domain and a Fe-S cluster-containing protein [Pseudomonas asplenii]